MEMSAIRGCITGSTPAMSCAHHWPAGETQRPSAKASTHASISTHQRRAATAVAIDDPARHTRRRPHRARRKRLR
eukprot:354685-Chlamydomonas_euryale.AAC.3